MYMQFFVPMQPPTTTHNAKQLHAYMKGGQPHAVLHDSPELKATRAKRPSRQASRYGCWSSGASPPRASAAAASGAPANPTPTTWKRLSRTR